MDLQEIKFDSFEANVNYALVRERIMGVALSCLGGADDIYRTLDCYPWNLYGSFLHAIAFWSVLDERGLLKGSHFDELRKTHLCSYLCWVEEDYTVDVRLVKIKVRDPVFFVLDGDRTKTMMDVAGGFCRHGPGYVRVSFDICGFEVLSKKIYVGNEGITYPFLNPGGRPTEFHERTKSIFGYSPVDLHLPQGCVIELRLPSFVIAREMDTRTFEPSYLGP